MDNAWGPRARWTAGGCALAGLLAAATLQGPAAVAAEDRVPPRAGCLDTRTIVSGRLVAPREALLRTRTGQGRLHLLTDCPAPPEDAELGTVSADGWACAGGGAWLRSGDALCPVVAWQPLDAEAFSAATRTAEGGDVPMLAPVEVSAGRRRGVGFSATTDTCFDSRFVRGWRRDVDGLVVEVAPARHAGNRYYRVETSSACTDADSADAVSFTSGVGHAAVCGRAGDKVVLERLRSQHPEIGDIGMPPTFGRGCTISRVYPLRD